MPMRLAFASRCVGAAVLLIGVVAWCLCAAAAEPAHLRFGISAGINTAVQPALYAKTAGLFAKYGIDATFTAMNDDPTAVQGLIANQYDMLYAGAGPGLIAIGRGADIRIVSSFTPVSDSVLIAQRDVRGIKDLPGRVLAVSKIGSLSYLMTVVTLKREGIDVDKVQILAAGNDTAKAQMVAAGRVDATTLNGIGVAPILGPDSTLHIVYDIGKALQGQLLNTVVFARGDFIRDHPEIVEAAVKALIEASRALQSDPALAVRQAVSTGLPAGPVQSTYDRLFAIGVPYYGVDGGIDRAIVGSTIATLHEFNVLDPAPTVDAAVDMSFVQAAIKALGPYKP